jgi:predicted aspartyl protease
LRKTFDENENEEFEKNLKNLQEKITIFQSLNFFRDFSESAQNFEVLRSTYLTTADFKYFVEDFGEIRTNFNYEILRKNLLGDLNSNLLHSITFFNPNEDFVEPFLEKIQKVLSKSESATLILAQDEFKRSLLMLAAWKMKLENLKVFWNLIEKNLNEEERKKLLLVEEEGWWTALQFSTQNKDPNSFLFMKKIYEKFFTQEEIRSILLKHNPQYAPFISNIISYASPETALEVSKYLENVFKNEKLELRKILSHQSGGASIFSFHKDKTEDEEKFKVFTELLRKTFEENQEQEFRNFLYELEKERPTGYFT